MDGSKRARGGEEEGRVGSDALSALVKEMFSRDAAAPEARWISVAQAHSVAGRFELIREIGRGGFGIVYEARDLELGRTVAFKALLPCERPDVSEDRLLQEAEVAARLSHPNIVAIHDVGRSEYGPYLILELLHGTTLQRRLAAGPLAPGEALRIAAEVAKGLAHAHAHGVIHRDLTPENVFLCDDGQVKVLDLGMASLFGRKKVAGGTPAYMAPEQWSGAPEDERTDVFALGVVLHRMLANELPFPGDGGVSAGRPRSAPLLRPPVEPALAALVRRMLARDPVGRPRDAGEVLEALQALQSPPEETGGGRAGRAPSRAAARLHDRALPMAIGAGLVALVASAALATRTAQTWVASVRGAPAPMASIAVLPFVDVSPGKDQEYFADGIAEEILNALANVEGLHVAGRTSSFYFKHRDARLSEIGRELKVADVLEGSVHREGSRIRVSAQVVDVAQGFQLWSGVYDRELTDIFAVQDEIARTVVQELKGTLLAGHGPIVNQHRTTRPDAYNEYLLARHLFDLGTQDGFTRAVAALERALAIDPSYAPAWAWLSVTLLNSAPFLSSPEEVDRVGGRAMAAAERAVALAPDLAESWSARGWMRTTITWDWDGARSDLERAISLRPHDPNILLRESRLLALRGHLPEAIAEARKVLDLDPLYAWAWTFLAIYYDGDGQPTRAREAATRALEIAPEQIYALRELAMADLLAGDPRAALEIFQHHRWDVIRLAGTALAQHDLGDERAAQAALETLRSRYAEREAYEIALVYAWLGQTDAAFQWLDRAVAQHGGGGMSRLAMRSITFEPLLRKVRGDPRYPALLARMQVPRD